MLPLFKEVFKIDRLGKYGTITLAIFGMLAFFVFIAFLIAGALWISVKVLPILETIFNFTLVISIIILLPLALFHKTRGWSGVGLFLASHVFGLNLWVWSFLLVYQFWGIIGIVIGLILAGIGIIPTAFVAILFGNLSYMPDMIFLLVCTFGARILGTYLAAKYEEKQERIYSAKFGANLPQHYTAPIE